MAALLPKKKPADLLDYSRWDNLECSDDEGDGTNGTRQVPTVTRLDTPSSVTFGGGNSRLHQKSTAASLPSPGSCSALKQCLHARMTENGAGTPTHWWCQTRNDVTVRFIVNNAVKARDVKLQVEERFLRFTIKGEDQLKASGGALHLPVQPVSDMLDIDWEIERHIASENGTNLDFVRVTLSKKAVSGVLIWWDRIFRSDKSQIDVSKISDRRGQPFRKASASSLSSSADTSKSSSQLVWEEAHAIFRERVKARHARGPEEI